MHTHLKIKRDHLVFILISVICLSFAIYTRHAWEDWYITYRCSKNLALGEGLVYTAGQRVHAFTSPLGVLIPSILNKATFNFSDGLVLWLFRIAGCALLGAAAVLLAKTARQCSLKKFAVFFMIGMFATNTDIIDFSLNGMEAAFMVFFLACLIHYMTASQVDHLAIKLGSVWAALMWTRPDSFIYITGLSLGYLIFDPVLHCARPRRRLLLIYLRAGLVALLIYLPWTIWTKYYYGTIVPHPVVAKGLAKLMNNIGPAYLFNSGVKSIYSSLQSLYAVFMPPWYSFGGWAGLPWMYSKPLAFICAFYWVLPRGIARFRAVSLAVLIAHIYLTFFSGAAPWYIPSVALLSIYVLSGLIQQLIAARPDPIFRSSKRVAGLVKLGSLAAAGAILLVSSLLFVLAAYQLRVQQKVIEDGHRKQIGLWLKENSRTSDDTVFLEPLGYIGFFSQLKMYDWPGLCSPEVIAARKKIGTDGSFAEIISRLKPDWLVLRPHEAKKVFEEMPDLLAQHYDNRKIFDVSGQVESYKFLPGRGYLIFDQTFIVFKKKN